MSRIPRELKRLIGLFKQDRDAVDSEPILYRTPVDLKYRLQIGAWSLKTVAGLEVIVRPKTVSVLFSWPVLQPLLRSKWVFDTSETSCEVSGEPSPRIFGWQWIILRSDRPIPRGDVAIRKSGKNEKIWAALMTAGVRAASDPP